jgi:Domain of unknown function (DUF5668)
MRYRYNPYCSCARCRAHGFMGPAVLITLGVLFLLAQVSNTYWLNFDRTWPALLIVIGLVLFLRHSAPMNGHVPREYAAVPPANVGYGQAPYGQAPVAPGTPGTVVTSAPIQPGGSLPPAPYPQGGSNPNDTEVHHG